MIPLHISITTVGGPKEKKRVLTQAINIGMMAAIDQEYYRRFLKEHFKPSAVKKYGYEKRTKKYQISKARKKHHQNPLVWSGSLKRELTGSIELKALKASSGASGKMRGRALRLSGRENMPDMKAEVTATVPAEIKSMARVIKRVAAGRLNNLRRRETVKVC